MSKTTKKKVKPVQLSLDFGKPADEAPLLDRVAQILQHGPMKAGDIARRLNLKDGRSLSLKMQWAGHRFDRRGDRWYLIKPDARLSLRP